MLLKLLRYVRGSVGFCARGKFPERFLNLTAREGVALWNAVPVEGGLTACMSAADYRRIRPIARRAGVTARITRKKGLPFASRRLKGRMGLPIGAAAGIVLMLFLSCFIWSVQVVGAKNLSETTVKQALAEQGIKPGAWRFGIRADAVGRAVEMKLGKLSWISVNIVGSTVDAEIKERVEKPEIPDETPCNIKAAKDGVITSINAAQGETKTSVGSGVRKGDMLVSGVMDTERESVRYLHAEAEIFADVTDRRQLRTERAFDYSYLSGETAERKLLRVLWLEFPVSAGFSGFERSVYSESNSALVLNGTALPLELCTQTEFEVNTVPAELDRPTAGELFKRELMIYELFERGESERKRRDITIREDETGFNCRADYVFNENIAESVEFSVTGE